VCVVKIIANVHPVLADKDCTRVQNQDTKDSKFVPKDTQTQRAKSRPRPNTWIILDVDVEEWRARANAFMPASHMQN